MQVCVVDHTYCRSNVCGLEVGGREVDENVGDIVGQDLGKKL